MAYGPFAKSHTSYGLPIATGFRPPIATWYRSWYTQPAPRIQPLPYTYQYMSMPVSKATGISAGYKPLELLNGFDDHGKALAINKAYGKFVDKVSAQQQWANNLVERQKTLDGLVQNVERLTRLARAVRRFDIKGIAIVLDIDVRELQKRHRRSFSKRKRKKDYATRYRATYESRYRPLGRGVRNAGGLWLELHFGWVPLVEDVHAALDSLNRDPNLLAIKAGAQIETSTTTHQGSGVFRGTTVYKTSTGCVMRAHVRIFSSNSSLLADSGLMNPMAILWEAVPFSFVVDWFTNVGQVLSSHSDLFGRELTLASTTVIQERSLAEHSVGYVMDLPGPSTYPNWTSDITLESFRMERGIGIAKPVLKLKPLKGFSLIRGVTAVSLLLQQLKSFK